MIQPESSPAVLDSPVVFVDCSGGPWTRADGTSFDCADIARQIEAFMRKWTTTCESMTAKILRVVETTWVTHPLTPEKLRNGVHVDVEYVLRARLPLDRTTREIFADLTAYTTWAEYGYFMGAILTMPDPKPDVVLYGELRARRSGGLRDVTYRATTSPVVLNPDFTGLARDEAGEPAVVE